MDETSFPRSVSDISAHSRGVRAGLHLLQDVPGSQESSACKVSKGHRQTFRGRLEPREERGN